MNWLARQQHQVQGLFRPARFAAASASCLPALDSPPLAHALIHGAGPGSLLDASYGALAQLLSPIHGDVRETAAKMLSELSPGLLGLRKGRPCGPVPTAPDRSYGLIRARVLHFATQILRCEAACRPGWQ